MNGFYYIRDWNADFIVIGNLLIGVVSFFSLIGIGRYMMSLLKLQLSKPWDKVFQLISGTFIYSLLNQIGAFLSINNYLFYGVSLIALLGFGFKELIRKRSFKNKLSRASIIPTTLLIALFLIRIGLSVIPTTKIDELNYHMLLPLRIIEDQGLLFYKIPEEGAILPHMHYQMIGSPFFSIGVPESLNVLSILIFCLFIYSIIKIISQETKIIELGLWCAVLITTGLHSTVDMTTNSSTSLLLLSSSLSLLILCNPQKFLPTKEIRSFSLLYGMLLLGVISSKVSMIPVALLQVIFFFKVINDYWGYKKFKKAGIFLLIPFLIFYLPLLIYTWIISGSPFGSLFSSFFGEQDKLFDPLVKSIEGTLGWKGNFKEVFLLMFTKWSPIIWFSWIILLTQINFKNLRITTTPIIFFIVQFSLIWTILPDKPRNFYGILYCAIIICFIKLGPIIYRNFNKFVKLFFIIFSLPWLFLDVYYSFPLLSKAFLNNEKFKTDYVPFYNDFKKIDSLIDKNSQIIAVGSRVNAYHFPRKVYLEISDIRDYNRSTYLFLVNDQTQLLNSSIKIGKLIYENNSANIYCYRKPGKECIKENLKIYRIELN